MADPVLQFFTTGLPGEEHLHQPNRWAAGAHGIEKIYNRWIDEDVLLHECVALSSWESR